MDPTRARAILQSLADGLDPATGAPFPPGSACQHPDTVRSEPRSMFVAISYGAVASARHAEGTRDHAVLHHGDRAAGRMKTRISPPKNSNRVGRRTPVTSVNPRNAHISGEYHHAPCVRMCVQSPPRFDLFRLVPWKPGNQSQKAKNPAFTNKSGGLV